MLGEIALTIAAGIWFFSGVPQVVKLLKSKSARNLSFLTFGGSFFAYNLFLLGNYLTGNMTTLYIFICPAAVSMSIFILMVKYRGKK